MEAGLDTEGREVGSAVIPKRNWWRRETGESFIVRCAAAETERMEGLRGEKNEREKAGK